MDGKVFGHCSAGAAFALSSFITLSSYASSDDHSKIFPGPTGVRCSGAHSAPAALNYRAVLEAPSTQTLQTDCPASSDENGGGAPDARLQTLNQNHTADVLCGVNSIRRGGSSLYGRWKAARGSTGAKSCLRRARTPAPTADSPTAFNSPGFITEPGRVVSMERRGRLSTADRKLL